jgi:hypothetical protein
MLLCCLLIGSGTLVYLEVFYRMLESLMKEILWRSWFLVYINSIILIYYFDCVKYKLVIVFNFYLF